MDLGVARRNPERSRRGVAAAGDATVIKAEGIRRETPVPATSEAGLQKSVAIIDGFFVRGNRLA
jgi:hypothetical protein